jgi:hypothetical protein
MTQSTKSKRIVIATSSLAETQPFKKQKILYCWVVEKLVIRRIIPIVLRRKKPSL